MNNLAKTTPTPTLATNSMKLITTLFALLSILLASAPTTSRAALPAPATLAKDTEIPIIVSGAKVGSMLLKAGEAVTITAILPDGVMVQRGENAPILIPKENVNNLDAAITQPAPNPVIYVNDIKNRIVRFIKIDNDIFVVKAETNPHKYLLWSKVIKKDNTLIWEYKYSESILKITAKTNNNNDVLDIVGQITNFANNITSTQNAKLWPINSEDCKTNSLYNSLAYAYETDLKEEIKNQLKNNKYVTAREIPNGFFNTPINMMSSTNFKETSITTLLK